MGELEEYRKIIDDIDLKLSELYCRRMAVVKEISDHKKKNGISVFDKAREAEIENRLLSSVSDDIKPYYGEVLHTIINTSKFYQRRLGASECEKTVNLGKYSYNIAVGKGYIKKADELFDLSRKVLIVTESGVPSEYVKTVELLCKTPYIYVHNGKSEDIKTFDSYGKILAKLLEYGFTRSDCIVAVGGGTVCDAAGFAASTYLRGIDFYSVPTTLLSQIDACVGGKNAVNFGNVKNSVGSFYQPKKVIVDCETLKTLHRSELINGLAEAIKIAACLDEKLFCKIEEGNAFAHLEEVVSKCLDLKIGIVEEDEKENGVRRVLNFGHTVGHAIEIEYCMSHGTSVALGMLPMCSQNVQKRLIEVYKKYELPYEFDFDAEKLKFLISRDKKADKKGINAVIVDKIGEYAISPMSVDEIADRINEYKKGF